jgi:hypothetical protein
MHRSLRLGGLNDIGIATQGSSRGSRISVDFASATVKHVPTEARKLAPLTLSWHEIPEWQQENKYILSGYRR